MDQNIIMPTIVSRVGTNRQETLATEKGMPNGTNSFLAKSIVVFTAGTTILTSTNTAPSDGDQVSIGGQVYTFKTTLTPTIGQVLINTTADAALLNLARAINGTGTAGTDYATGTVINPYVSSSASVTSHTITLTGKSPYIVNIALTTPVGTTLSFTAAYLGNAGLHAVATAGVLACGICPDASVVPAQAPPTPPTALYGDRHWPFNLVGTQFQMNIAAFSGGGAVVGQANSAKQLSSITVGSTYGIATATTGTYAGYQFLDPTNTSNLLLTVVDIPSLGGVGISPQTSATYNGIVTVQIATNLLQSV